ncbi:MAG: hypothetical protein GXO32_06580 [Crenarchaeota archaeon]|nr:hypothetical protein [Thermoproteota archaeon]
MRSAYAYLLIAIAVALFSTAINDVITPHYFATTEFTGVAGTSVNSTRYVAIQPLYFLMYRNDVAHVTYSCSYGPPVESMLFSMNLTALPNNGNASIPAMPGSLTATFKTNGSYIVLATLATTLELSKPNASFNANCVLQVAIKGGIRVLADVGLCVVGAVLVVLAIIVFKMGVYGYDDVVSSSVFQYAMLIPLAALMPFMTMRFVPRFSSHVILGLFSGVFSCSPEFLTLLMVLMGISYGAAISFISDIKAYRFAAVLITDRVSLSRALFLLPIVLFESCCVPTVMFCLTLYGYSAISSIYYLSFVLGSACWVGIAIAFVGAVCLALSILLRRTLPVMASTIGLAFLLFIVFPGNPVAHALEHSIPEVLIYAPLFTSSLAPLLPRYLLPLAYVAIPSFATIGLCAALIGRIEFR